MKIPLNCLALSSQSEAGASQDSVRTPALTSEGEARAASARRRAVASVAALPVARQTSTAAPIASPWL